MADTVEFNDSRIVKKTGMATLCVIDGKQIWIPDSQICDDSEIWKEGDEGKLVISEFIALQKGLI
jgi:hypothetical protein